MHGNIYRLELDVSKRTNVARGPSGSYDHFFITKTDQPAEAEAMLHGLTLPQLVRDVRAFNERFELPRPMKPTDLDDKLSDFRYNFMCEELAEWNQASCDENRAEQLDALVDLVYVAIGTAVMAGWDFEEAWRRVHAANMKKVPARMGTSDNDLNPAKPPRHALDVVKPEGWVAPDLSDLVR